MLTFEQHWLDQAFDGLRLIREQRLTPVVIEHLATRIQLHQQTLAAKVEDYCVTRSRITYLQEESSELARELGEHRQSVKDTKRRLSRHTSALDKARRTYTREENELKMTLAKAHQRLQRRLRHVSTVAFRFACAFLILIS